MFKEKKVDNFLMRSWLESIQMVIGLNGLKSILNYAHLEKYINNFPPDNNKTETPITDLQSLFRSLYELFGRKGTRSLSLRTGRTFAVKAIEGRPTMAKGVQLASRFVPETKKMYFVLKKLEEQYKEMITSPSEIISAEVKEEKDYFLIIFREHFESEGVLAEVPVCDVFLGMIQYFMEWITGHEHTVEEIECRAMGHPADVFKIVKARK